MTATEQRLSRSRKPVTKPVTLHKQVLELAAGQYSLRGYGSPGLNELCGEFVEAVLHGGPSPIPAEDGLAALQVVHAAYESARTTRPVDPRTL